MPNLEHNMDELFRRAADHYPLKINESRWKDIAPLLTEQPTTTPSRKKPGLKKYTVLLLLLLLSLLLADGLIDPGRESLQQPIVSAKQETKADPSVSIRKPTKSKYSIATTKQDIDAMVKQLLHKKETHSYPGKKTLSFRKEKTVFYANTPITRIQSLLKPLYSTSGQPILAGSVQPSPYKKLMLLEKQSLPTGNDKEDRRQQKAFYLGVSAGPLFDEVKNQGLKKTGFNFGLIAGYRIRNKFSLETGLLFAQKPYFSTGQYFSMDKVSGSMPQGMEILSLEGKNEVLEIPVKIKYDFLHKPARHFFSTAGFSSYICTHEKNNYLTAMNGVQQTMTSSYKNRSRSLAATMDLSVGYEHKIGRSQTIRIEPYIQIPLHGMGVGSMPMKSTGIKIGITRFFY
jgi:hypothetical protein